MDEPLKADSKDHQISPKTSPVNTEGPMVPKTESVISSPSSTSLQPNLGVTIPGTTQASETLSSSLPPLWPPTQASATLGVVRSSHSKQKTDENGDKRPPRPPNAWILYRSDCIQKHRENRPPGAPKPTQAELSKLFGEQWRNESDEVKGGYERLAEAAREEHAQKYPDWRFSRRPVKQALATDATMTSQTPQSRHTKLQLPLSDDETRKRRRNTSGSPSDDPTLYSTPPEYIGGGLPSAFSSDGSIIRSQAPHLTALNRSNNKHAYISSALGHASLQSSAANEVEAKGGANFDPLLDPQTSYNSYKTFPQQEGYGQEGLNSTLAVRNASAAQFYNINELSPRSTTTLARPNTSQGVGADSSVTFPHSFTFGDSVSAPVGSEHLGFYPNGGALPFDQPQLSLPSMPFGMTPQEINSSPPLFSNGQVQWPTSYSSVAPPAVPRPVSAVNSSPQQPIGLDCPEWLYALRHVKVRLDNFAGIPLLDLLGDLHTQRSHSGIPEAIPTPVGLLEPSD